METKTYLIVNEGCDAETLFEMELTEDDFDTIMWFIKENNKHSGGGCEPHFKVFEKYKIGKQYYYNEDNNILKEIKEDE